MGRGVFLPNETDGRHDIYYSAIVDRMDYEESREEDEQEDIDRNNYEDLLQQISDVLPKSFSWDYDARGRNHWIGDDELILATNGLFAVTLHEDDCKNYAVTVRVKPTILPWAEDEDSARLQALAMRQLLPTARVILNGLHRQFPNDMRVRTSGYTTGEFTPL